MKVLLILFLLISVTVWSAPKEEATPAVINDLGQHLVQRQGMVADKLEVNKRFWPEFKFKQLKYMNNAAAFKITAAAFEYALCIDTKQGYYCDQALKDLQEARYELDKLDKEIEKAGEIKL